MRNNLKRALYVLLILAGSAMAAPIPQPIQQPDPQPVRRERQLPKPFAATYAISIKGIVIARMKQKFARQENDHYVYETRTKATGLVALLRKDTIREKSTWRVHNGEIQPLGYEYRHQGSKKNRDKTITFDWATGRIKSQVKGAPWETAIVPGILDKLLYQLVLMEDLKSGGRHLKYTIADGRKIKTYLVESLGEERLVIPLGTFQTIKLKRYRPRGKRKAIIWSAPALGFIPVRVDYHEKNGSITTAILKNFSRAGNQLVGPK